MGYLVRLILLILAIWVIVRLIRNWLRQAGILDDKKSDKASATLEGVATTRCAHCGTYIPKTSAINRGGADYCSEEHAKLSQK